MIKKTVVVLQNDLCDAREFEDNLSMAFDVILSTDDADLAVKTVKSEKPDYLITSLSLKNTDGISVVELIRGYSQNTRSIMVSVVNNDILIKQAMDVGVVYYMIKPVNFDTLIKRMLSLDQRDEEKGGGSKKIDERLSRIFIGIGIPPHIKGYGYLREGIRLAVEEPEIINSITKRLYPSIGRRFNTSASKVERAIRHAIEVAWSKGRIDSFNSLFGVRAYTVAEKPTNSEFIALIADRLLLDKMA